MPTNSISYTAKAGLEMPLRRALQNFPSALSLNESPALAAYNLGVAEIAIRFARVLDELDKFPEFALNFDAPSDDFVPGPLLGCYRELIYSLAEYYEFVGKLPHALGTPKQERIAFEAKWHRHKRHATIICNKLKHEHNQLVYNVTLYPWGSLCHGFSVYRYRDGMLTPNQDAILRGRESASFNLRLRADFCDFLTMDYSAANLSSFSQFCAVSSKLSESNSKYETQLGALAKRVASRSELGFRKERSLMIETLRFQGEELIFGLQKRQTSLPPLCQVRTRQQFPGDGVTTIYKIADWTS